jgi:hypothetical protein
MTSSGSLRGVGPRFLAIPTKIYYAVFAFGLFSGCALGQQSLPTAPSAQLDAQPAAPAAQVADERPVTIPAGTRLSLVLTRPVDSRATHKGDSISAQVTAPVIINDQVVIPAGTFVQGQSQKLTRHGTQAEMVLQSPSLVFANGYIAKLGEPVNIESDEWTTWNNPSDKTKAGMIAAPLAGTGLGLLIGAATDKTQTTNLGLMTVTTKSHSGLVAGAAIGGAIGFVTSMVLLARSHSFYVADGSPLNMSLPQPITLTEQQINAADQSAPSQPVPMVVQKRPPPSVPSSTDHGTCYTPGTPGTPDIVIPGTPAIGNSPGTPNTVIPGIPPRPPVPYPCP